MENTKKKTSKLKGAPLPAKYKDPASGKTWAGRGRLPVFIRNGLANGKTLDDFKI